MEINKIAQEIHSINIEKGFWEDRATKNIGEMLMLIVSELAEALEAHRKGHKSCSTEEFDKSIQAANSAPMANTEISTEEWKRIFEEKVKNSFEDELADTVIRVLDVCAGMGIDLEWHISQKMKYNRLRPYKHGKAY
jgi:NTP pyrophosphatase (non-canonical NTP hydrolase)